MQIGTHTLSNNVFVAPMAGVTDYPFRKLCCQLGAGYAVSEMVSANPLLWETEKSINRSVFRDGTHPRSVQITGSIPELMAACAKHYVALGAQIIDINMGCPVKKVCNNWCGSALLRDENRVAGILRAVVKAVDVPVTLKYRTGWNRQNKNALTIARIAESEGVAMLTLHGRTREDAYLGSAEYETIAQVKAGISIPVVANGDIDSPIKAKQVLDITKADAVMIGRAAQGRPWIFRETVHYLQTGQLMAPPRIEDVRKLVRRHLLDHYAFYGEKNGVRSARKHIGWYISSLPESEAFRKQINQVDSGREQLEKVDAFFESQLKYGERLQDKNFMLES